MGFCIFSYFLLVFSGSSGSVSGAIFINFLDCSLLYLVSVPCDLFWYSGDLMSCFRAYCQFGFVGDLTASLFLITCLMFGYISLIVNLEQI